MRRPLKQLLAVDGGAFGLWTGRGVYAAHLGTVAYRGVLNATDGRYGDESSDTRGSPIEAEREVTPLRRFRFRT
ncbi:hypothetical protein [Haloprofundus salinisoli]|uniref:hypothetical protein n=1 Tax=Haloprofundus salinisoli TaxID=2876193 RepID=UPI001CCDDEF5|nr:hypothetical protein [Haloprofundus salinisoli]